MLVVNVFVRNPSAGGSSFSGGFLSPDKIIYENFERQVDGIQKGGHDDAAVAVSRLGESEEEKRRKGENKVEIIEATSPSTPRREGARG